LAVIAFTVSGCGGGLPGNVIYGAGFRGAAVADEPHAATVAAGILKQGGSAADAAVALYFAMAVTYPSAAGLGGGGVCLASDWKTGEIQSLDFLAPRPARIDDGIRPTAVPANVRGMAALHARFGILDWRAVLAPAEKMAHFGHAVSRATARAMREGGAVLSSNWETWRIFAASGQLPGEGEILVQADLARILERLRVEGAAELYTGALAGEFAEAVRRAGGTLTADDLRNFVPRWQAAASMKFGNDRAYFSPPPSGAGLVSAQMLQMLFDEKRYRRAKSDERLHLLVETAKRAFEGRAKWLAGDGATIDMDGLIDRDRTRKTMAGYKRDSASATDVAAEPTEAPSAGAGFVVVDLLGDVVACNFTMYEPFGSGMVAAGTGVLVAPAPGPDQRNPMSLGPMIVYNATVRSFKFAAVGGDGAAGPTAMAGVAAEAMLVKRGRLDKAIARARVHAPGADNVVIVEDALAAKQVDALTARGHSVRGTPSLGRVNAIYCASGYPAEPTKMDCLAETDPRGHGLVVFPD
jgi:gamma-glutamyltranspeptidase/glutathione hydrolase